MQKLSCYLAQEIHKFVHLHSGGSTCIELLFAALVPHFRAVLIISCRQGLSDWYIHEVCLDSRDLIPTSNFELLENKYHQSWQKLLYSTV